MLSRFFGVGRNIAPAMQRCRDMDRHDRTGLATA
jgi:hypothetical protein